MEPLRTLSRHSFSAFSFARLVAPLGLLLTLATGCGQAKWKEVVNPNTGDAQAEKQTGNLNPQNVRTGEPAYVAPERLRARTEVGQNPEEAPVTLDRGDKVVVTNPNPESGNDEGLVEVSVESTQQDVEKEKVYVPAEYLQREPVATRSGSRYVMIQNIATEKLRVYEISETKGRPNRLIIETDMTNGEVEPSKTRRTALGSYRIESWHKFYEDVDHLFPSWFDARYPEIPLPGASLEDWTRKSQMPKGPGLARGAFGWYTAKIGPNAFAQWTHGTLGWGADRDRFIKIPRAELKDVYSDPRGFGCTRVENRAIAYLQDLLPVGTPVLKIYAREAVAHSQSEATESPSPVFEFTLTKDEVRGVNPMTSNRPAQLLRAVPESMILEEGQYPIDTHPDAVEFSKTVRGVKLSAEVVRPEANVYGLDKAEFNGVFYVDQGLLAGYRHPKSLRLGGYKDQVLPGIVIKRQVAKQKAD